MTVAEAVERYLYKGRGNDGLRWMEQRQFIQTRGRGGMVAGELTWREIVSVKLLMMENFLMEVVDSTLTKFQYWSNRNSVIVFARGT